MTVGNRNRGETKDKSEMTININKDLNYQRKDLKQTAEIFKRRRNPKTAENFVDKFKDQGSLKKLERAAANGIAYILSECVYDFWYLSSVRYF